MFSRNIPINALILMNSIKTDAIKAMLLKMLVSLHWDQCSIPHWLLIGLQPSRYTVKPPCNMAIVTKILTKDSPKLTHFHQNTHKRLARAYPFSPKYLQKTLQSSPIFTKNSQKTLQSSPIYTKVPNKICHCHIKCKICEDRLCYNRAVKLPCIFQEPHWLSMLLLKMSKVTLTGMWYGGSTVLDFHTNE